MAKDPGLLSGEPATTASQHDLLKRKEQELAQVVDEHDDLVREQYHLETFVTMIVGFDPAVVKHERGQDYDRYARRFDLFIKFGDQLPGRTSRRRAPAAPPTALPPAFSSKSSTAKPSIPHHVETPSQASGSKATVADTKQLTLPEGTRSSRRIRGGPSMVNDERKTETTPVKVSSSNNNNKGKARARVVQDIEMADDADTIEVSTTGRARAKPIKAQPSKASKRKSQPQEVSTEAKSKRPRTKATARSPTPEPLPPAPPPHVTCPEQLPTERPKFGGSVANLLASYMMLEEKDLDPNAVRNLVVSRFRTRERVRQLQLQGRMLGELEEVAETQDAKESIEGDRPSRTHQQPSKTMVVSAMRPQAEPKRVPDHHSALLAHAVQVRNAMLAEWKTHNLNAKKLSRAVQVYWDIKLGSKEREAREEERRRKMQMRELVKGLKAKWQLAVNIVRARRMAEEKAEQDRLGKEHLQSILERSRDLLGKSSKPEQDDEESDGGTEEPEAATSDEESEAQDDDEPEEEQQDSESLDGQDSAEEAYQQLLSRPLVEQPLESNHVQDDTSPGTHDQIKAVTTRVDDQSIRAPAATNVSELTSTRAKSDRARRSTSKSFDPTHFEDQIDPDADDVEFVNQQEVSDEDLDLDVEMEAEDEQDRDKVDSDDDDDDDEDAGLLADADLPMDELLKKYGYVSNVNGSVNGQDEDRIDTEADVMESEKSESDDDDTGSDEHSSAESEEFEPSTKDVGGVKTPFLLRANLRRYQQAGLEWLAQLYKDQRNAILADEMGLGKTLQTIALLAHLACDHGQWGPHLIVVPTSVILNWEMEFKKFLPGFKILTYYGNQQERKDLRKGWLAPHAFQVVITSYQIVLADEAIFKRRQWQYLILDEAHNIKNFRSQRWQTLLGFRSERRLLLTGTPLQNNLMELWSLLYFLMPHGLANDSETGGFANHKEFNEWFSNPMEKAMELDGVLSEEAKATVNRLHLILRPYILRRLKADVEKQLPGKFEHVVYCNLSKRQRFLYDEFMSRSSTRESLISGGYLGVANCLMQLRKVCNHPDLFEVRPIRTSFAMDRSVVGEEWPVFDRVQRLLPIRSQEEGLLSRTTLDVGSTSLLAAFAHGRLDASDRLPYIQLPQDEPAADYRTIAGWKVYQQYRRDLATRQRWESIRRVNRERCTTLPVLGTDTVAVVRQLGSRSQTMTNRLRSQGRLPLLVQQWAERISHHRPVIDRFAMITPPVVSRDIPSFALPVGEMARLPECHELEFDTLHPLAVKLQIAFPDRSLLQHDCGKLQVLSELLKRLKSQGHRVLIFTQMTRMLDILEIFLSHNGHRYSRLDGSTKVEDRLLVTERFNASPRIFALIASTRSGGVGVNLTGADTVIFYDNEFNPAMDKQATDRAHRIGQTREVHIYRLVTAHTVEENMLKKANQKRRLDDLVMQEGEFTTEQFSAGKTDLRQVLGQDVLNGLDLPPLPLGGGGGGGGGRSSSGSATPGQPIHDTTGDMDGSRMQEALAQAEDEEDAAAARQAYQDIELDAPDFGPPEEGASLEQQQQQQQQQGEGTNTAKRDASTPRRTGGSSTPGGDVSRSDTLMDQDDGVELAERASEGAEGEDDEEDDEEGAIDEWMLAYVDHEWQDYFIHWPKPPKRKR